MPWIRNSNIIRTMKAIQYKKDLLKRYEEIFNEYDEYDKDCAALHLGEDLQENTKMLDQWLSDVNGFEGVKFDSNDPEHMRIFAKLDMINDELSDIIEDKLIVREAYKP